jgi:four helix bundle protein
MSSSIVQKKSFEFSLCIIRLYCELQRRHEYVISKQLLRSATSIGANVVEALAGQSRRDFLAKMSIASKEARETSYWLMLLDQSKLVEISVTTELKYVNELIRMLTSIVKTTGEQPK